MTFIYSLLLFLLFGKMKLKCISYIVDSSEKSVSFDHRFVHCCYFVHVVNTYNVSTWEVRKLLGSLSKANWLLPEPPHTAEEHVHHSYCVHEWDHLGLNLSYALIKTLTQLWLSDVTHSWVLKCYRQSTCKMSLSLLWMFALRALSIGPSLLSQHSHVVAKAKMQIIRNIILMENCFINFSFLFFIIHLFPFLTC